MPLELKLRSAAVVTLKKAEDPSPSPGRESSVMLKRNSPIDGKHDEMIILFSPRTGAGWTVGLIGLVGRGILPGRR